MPPMVWRVRRDVPLTGKIAEPMPECGLNAEYEIPARNEAVRRTLEELRPRLSGMGGGPQGGETAELVLAEVLNNVVEHAMAGHADGVIRLTLSADRAGLVCQVVDNGAAMPGGVLPRGALAAIGPRPDTLPEGGFGWHLIHRLTRDLDYCRAGGWNRLRFRLPNTSGEIMPWSG